MLQQLLQLEEQFQPFLRRGDYTFIGPEDQNLLRPFIDRANNLAPTVAISRSIHHALSHKASTRRALEIFPANTPFRIYVVSRTSGDALVHGTIEDYCAHHNIAFQP